MENLFSMAKPKRLRRQVYRIRLSQEMRSDALSDLNYMNINRATLFTGLDGFAESLRNEMLFVK